MQARFLLVFLLSATLMVGCGDSDGGDDRVWRVPQQISAISTTINSPQVAADIEGNVFAVWEQYGSIYSARYDRLTRAWSAPVDISPGAVAARLPDIDADSEGNAVVVWGDAGLIDAVRYNSLQSAWGTPVTISNSLAFAQTPDVLADTSGNAVVVWPQIHNSLYAISTARYNSLLGLWGAGETLSEGTESRSKPDIASDSSGNVFCVWEEGSNIYVSRYEVATGTWSPSTLLGTGRDPQVSAAPNGNAIAVWDSPTSPLSIQSRHYRLGVGWGGVNDVGNGDFPKIAVDSVGNGLALWQDAGRIFSTRYDQLSNNWGVIKEVETGFSVEVVVDRFGRWTAVWNDGGNIRAARYTSLEWGFPSTLSLVPALGAIPQVDVDQAGNVIVVWNDVDRIYVVRYE